MVRVLVTGGIVESVCCVPFQDSSKTSRKVSDKWVQTRGYQACVVYMPIPLRVLFSGSAHLSLTFLDALREPESHTSPSPCIPPDKMI